jgi:hypothetical protein
LQDDEEALTRPATKVQVDLAMSAYSNAAAHHGTRKRQMAKQEKTLAAHAEALKAAEKKAAVQLANLRNSATTAQASACGVFLKAQVSACMCICHRVCLNGLRGLVYAASLLYLFQQSMSSQCPSRQAMLPLLTVSYTSSWCLATA